MNFKDILSFEFKRVNPFPGLAIDADTWRDAHNYNRDQQRLHNLMFHNIGIVTGLEVTENDPPDMSVNIQPGAAIDPEGNTIIVRNIYHYQIQNRDKETIYLIIQFREILEGPYQPPEGGQPTRIVDGYRIQERDNLPEEPHLELARIELDPKEGVIRSSSNRLHPTTNEIDLNYRKEASQAPAQTKPESTTEPAPDTTVSRKEIHIGQVNTNGTNDGLNLHGLRNMARELELHYNWSVELEENVGLDDNIKRFTILYMAGGKNFSLSEEQYAALEGFLRSNGVLFAEDCGEDMPAGTKRNKNGPVYDEIVNKFHVELQNVEQDDMLLSNVNVFSEIPQGTKSGIFIKKDNIIYSNNDYGCAWQGGYKGNPISRDAIRSAFEMGANIADYAYQMKLSAGDETSAATE